MSNATVLAVAMGGVLALVVYMVIAYNTFVKLGKTMASALSDIDVFLKKRYDLVPNLVSVVKGYAAYESDVFRSAAQIMARAARTATVGGLSEFEGKLDGVFGGLFAVAENYPELKADKGFLKLQSQLVEVEDNIEHARRYYNAVVRDYNIYLESFPSNVVGGLFGLRPGEFYEVSKSSERLPVGLAYDKG